MSQGNVEIVRRIYQRWERGDFRAGVERYHADVLLILRPEFPEAGTYRGVDEIRRYMRDEFLADWEGAVIVGEEFLDAADSVVVRVNQRATGAGSGAPVALRYYQVWTFRGESVIRIESIKEREDALQAAGLGDCKGNRTEEDQPMEVATLAGLLREAAEHHHHYEQTSPEHDWADWYAPYISARERGSTPEEAIDAAGLYAESVR